MADAATITLPVGHAVSFEKTISDADVCAFAQVSGDTNPLHLDEAQATRTRFGKRVAHGILTAGVISAALGTKLAPPGTYIVYVGQTLQFRRPVFIGDTVRAECTVSAFDSEKNIATLAVVCTNQQGDAVLRGEAQVLLERLAT